MQNTFQFSMEQFKTFIKLIKKMRIFYVFIVISITFLFIKRADCYCSENNFLLDSISNRIEFYTSIDSANYNYISKVMIKMYPIHCAMGPTGCEKCKEFSKEKKYCFIGLLHKGGKFQRPIMQLDLTGTKTWYEFDQFKIFDSEEEAIEYSKENSIKILEEEK
jgi:hypothetical protein